MRREVCQERFRRAVLCEQCLHYADAMVCTVVQRRYTDSWMSSIFALRIRSRSTCWDWFGRPYQPISGIIALVTVVHACSFRDSRDEGTICGLAAKFGYCPLKFLVLVSSACQWLIEETKHTLRWPSLTLRAFLWESALV